MRTTAAAAGLVSTPRVPVHPYNPQLRCWLNDVRVPVHPQSLRKFRDVRVPCTLNRCVSFAMFGCPCTLNRCVSFAMFGCPCTSIAVSPSQSGVLPAPAP